METQELLAPMVATVVKVEVTPGAAVRAGQPVVVLESMKMEHLVRAPVAGVVAAQRQRRGLDDLIARTPADGLVTGIAEVNGSPCVVMAYDATVLAGTQGVYNHAKKDRMFRVAERRRLPVVLFAEGGGGRPG